MSSRPRQQRLPKRPRVTLTSADFTEDLTHWLRRRLRASPSTNRLLRTPDAVEEAVQETLLKAWKNRERYDSTKALFRTWLWRLAVNATYDLGRRKMRRPTQSLMNAAGGFQHEPASEENNPALRFVEEEAQTALAELLEVLPRPMRRAAELRYFEDLKLREIATRMRVPMHRVVYLLRRCEILLGEGLAAFA